MEVLSSLLQEIALELNQIREQLRTSEARHTADKDGSLFALQTAQAHLKERYARMKTEREAVQKQLTEYTHKQVSERVVEGGGCF